MDKPADDLDEEIQSHLEALAEHHMRQGLSPDRARLAARRDFGGVMRTREAYREMRRTRWLDDIRRDVRYALRTLARAPGFTAVVVLTLALGIGVNATLFALADAVLFRPLPFDHQERLVIAGATVIDTRSEVSYLDFLDWQSRARSFDGLAAMGLSNWTVTLRDGEPRALRFRAVSGTWFEVLGARAALGRTITAADDNRGAARVVVLSYGLWQRHFGGRSDVVGRTVVLDDAPSTIVGVMPRDFIYPDGAEAWSALVPALASIRGPGLPDFLAVRDAGGLHLVGRLTPGLSPDDARRELGPLVSELARAAGRTRPTQPRITPIADDLLGSAQRGLTTLLGAVGLLLLVTLANVAGLILIRAARRRGEYAIRAALGASRGALARQLLWESGVLALVSTAVGLGLSRLAVPVLLAYVPEIPRIQEATVDGRVALAGAVAGLITLAVCWLMPVIALRDVARGRVLLGAARTVTGGGVSRRAREVLVTLEVAVTLVLLTGAGLLYRSVSNMTDVDLGFATSGLLAVTLERPVVLGADRDMSGQFVTRVLDAVREIPGVVAVGAAGSRPLKGPIGLDSSWQFEGQSREHSGDNPWANVETITPGYFEAMAARLIAGRRFEAGDDATGMPVVVISQALARLAWPGGEAVGKRLRAAALDRDGVDTWHTVVGIVSDMRYRALGQVTLDVYAPLAQSPFSAEDIMVRTDGSTEAIAPLIRSRLRELNPSGAVTIDSMSDALAGHQAPWRANLGFFAVFAALTLFLATVGIYTVLASAVSERTREIGLRLTLGATPRGIVAHVVRSGASLTLVGVVIGITIASLAAGTIRGLLFDVGPHDRAVLAVATLIVAAATMAACGLPARRAARVDPAITLRAE